MTGMGSSLVPPPGNIGQYIQGLPIIVLEFTYLIVGAVVISPISKFRWPAVVSFWVRTALAHERVEAGVMFKSDEIPSVNVSFEVTRQQFTLSLLRLRRGQDPDLFRATGG